MVGTLPTVQSLKFATLGRNSLFHRFSDPVSLPTSTNCGEHVEDLEDSYVDMDVDDIAPEPPEPESGKTQPTLLSRLGRRIDSPSSSSTPVFFHPDGTYTPPAIGGASLPALTQSAENATSPQHAMQTTVVSSSGSSIPIVQPALEVMVDVVTQNNGDSYVEHTSRAITSGATVLESVASSLSFGPIMSPLHASASRTVRQTNDVTMPCVGRLASPSQRTGSPRFVFMPLSELLQEERDAWSEVFEKKQARQAQVRSSSGLSHQASSSTVSFTPKDSIEPVGTALRPIIDDRRLPAMSSVPTSSAIATQHAEVPAQSNVDGNSSQESIPSLPTFTPSPSRMLFDAIENSTPVIHAAEEQIRSAPTTVSPTLEDARTVDEGLQSLSTHHQAIPYLMVHPLEPASFSGQVKVRRGSLHQAQDHLPTTPSIEESSASPASTESIGRMSSAPSDVFARLLHVPRVNENVTPVSDMHPNKRNASPEPHIHQALKRQRTMIDTPSHEYADIARRPAPPAASASDQPFRTPATRASSGVDSLPRKTASTATSNFPAPTTGERRRNMKSELTIIKTEETGDFSPIVASLPSPAKIKKEEDDDPKAHVKLEEDSKIGIKKEDEDEDEKPAATTSTSSGIPLKVPKNDEGDPSFNDKEGSPTLHFAEELAEPVSGGRNDNFRSETSSESPGSTPRQPDIQPQDEQRQGDLGQEHQLETPVHEEIETRESDHHHVSHEVSNNSIPSSDVGRTVHVSQAAEYHEAANTRRGLERLEIWSATVTAAQNQANSPGELRAWMASPQRQTGRRDHLAVPVASRATSENTVSMSISPLATPAPRSAELDVQPAVTFDYGSQAHGHAAVRDHRSLSNEMQCRRPSPERPVRSYDHWSPTTSPAPSPRPRCRPRSPSPERIGPRFIDSYRPAYRRNRTPPRFSRRGLGGMLGSATLSGSPIRRDPRREVTQIGPSLRESADGEGPVALGSGNARLNAPPHSRFRPPTNFQQPSAEPKHTLPSPSSRVAIVNANFDDDDQRMGHDKDAKNDSHEHQLIPDCQLEADHKPIREGLPEQALVAPVSASSKVAGQESPPCPTSSPSFPQNSVPHSNAVAQAAPNNEIVPHPENNANRITDESSVPLGLPPPRIRQDEGVTQHEPAASSTKSLNSSEPQINHRLVRRNHDPKEIASADTMRVRETEAQENDRVGYLRTNSRLEEGGCETQHGHASPPAALGTTLMARISQQKPGSAASNENDGAEAMVTDSDTHTGVSSGASLNPRPLVHLKDRIGATQATANTTRRPDLDVSNPAHLANRIGSALTISESDGLSKAPSRSQRPAHLLAPKPSASYNEEVSDRSSKRVWLARPQGTNEPALLGRISGSGKDNGSRRFSPNNSFATRSNNSGQEQIYHTYPNSQAKKRPLEKRLS